MKFIVPMFMLLALWSCTPEADEGRGLVRMDIQSLIHVAEELRYVNFDTALTIAQTAYEIAEAYDNLHSQAQAHLLMGKLYLQIGGDRTMITVVRSL